MRFTFRQLEYFIAVGEIGTVAGAAEKMYVSAPSISAAITQLEKEFKVKFFVRHHAKGLSLTREGERFFIEAQTILGQAAHLNKVTSSLAQEVRGPLDLGCLGSIAPIIVPKLCKEFLQTYPDVQFTFQDATHSELLKSLHMSDIGIALTFDLKIPKDIVFTPLVALPPYVLISAANPLASRESISVRDLKGLAFIQVGSPRMRESAMKIFQEGGAKPDNIYKSPHTAVQGLVAYDHGYTFTYIRPKLKQNLDGSSLVTIPLKGSFEPLVLGTAMVNQHYRNPVVQAFQDFCCKYISEKSIPGALAPGEKG